ncbi:hypothetical protein GCM10022199_02150 [Marihabitans asiaticum]|uniref:Hemerythrin HHE cation binding domain-containing protein n=1 Tax=Marihabitans asiaticum TaxID=415218 RepID=A0A560WFY2_9MICO|nr:hemerythrin domain-containing protein [Marihabitans asiaticum]TWD16508.1 hemerythrin HHE cation binding domain-containing protein [Marihabitans asiaticum]
MDITEIIQHQHDEQRRMFAYLEQWPREDTAGLEAMWRRLAILLEVHAEAEERFFYHQLDEVGEGAGDAESKDEEITDAIKDHNKIREAVRRADSAKPGSEQWWQAVVDANTQNSDHMGEEERQDLTDFRQQASLQWRHDLAVQFLRFEAEHWAKGVTPVDKDPADFTG